jgi:excisionase family DNA binding protein
MYFDPAMCAEFGRIFTVQSAAEALHRSEDHIVRLINDGTLRASNIGRGKHRDFVITEEAIDDMLAKTAYVPPTKTPLPRRRKLPESGDSGSRSSFDASLEAAMKKYGG